MFRRTQYGNQKQFYVSDSIVIVVTAITVLGFVHNCAGRMTDGSVLQTCLEHHSPAECGIKPDKSYRPPKEPECPDTKLYNDLRLPEGWREGPFGPPPPGHFKEQL